LYDAQGSLESARAGPVVYQGSPEPSRAGLIRALTETQISISEFEQNLVLDEFSLQAH
jgi:hypothetical protein